MRDPQIVLKQLSSLKENQSVNNLYKNLYNPEFYKIAYQNIYQKSSQMTKASDGSIVDGMSIEKIDKLIQKLRDGTYQPTNLRRVSIPKKSGGTRKISVPNFDDKLVQEIIRMILEALWEPHFSEYSHGFRPNRSCHTALKYTQNKFQGTKWWIDADIKGCFDNINHVILLNTLKERIREQKFIHLINLFLKAGYIENWQYHKTYSGVPQGSIIGPILCNIYLDKFDKFMENLISKNTCGTRRKMTTEYHSISNKLYKLRKKKEWKEVDKEEYDKLIKERDNLIKQGKTSKYDDPNYRRLSYVRYADDILIGIVGSKRNCEDIKKEIKNFLEINLKLNINEEKTKILHRTEMPRFLGYDISSYVSTTEKTKMNGLIHLWLPYEVCKNFIIDNRFGKFVCDSKTGKPKLRGECRKELTNVDDLEILFQYNAKIRGLYNYYKMASNVCKLNDFNYVCQLSFLRTLANKYRTSCAKLYKNKNYCQNGHIGITYKDKFYEFFNGPFNVVKTIKYEPNIDLMETLNKYFSRTSLIQRLEANKCEIEGCESNGPFEVHHVKKLKDLKNKKCLKDWEKLMIARNRKTLILCQYHHKLLHTGKL